MAFEDMFNLVKIGASNADPVKFKGISTIVQFELSGDDGGNFYFEIAHSKVEALEGSHEKPNVTLKLSLGDFNDLVTGELNGTNAFMAGKLKIAGDLSLAMRLQTFLGVG